MTEKIQTTRSNPHGDRGKALSPDKLRNTTAPRKTEDQPEDKNKSRRDPEKDYAGESGKNH